MDCGSAAGKHPFIMHWRNVATTDLDMIQTWWRLRPLSNIGVLMGGQANLICIDVDGEVGAASLAELEAKFAPLPPTLTQSTGRPDSGTHRIFHVDMLYSDLIRNRARIAPGIDVRANGGLIVAAPSMHASGTRYRWHDENAAIAELPKWMLEIATSAKARQYATSEHGDRPLEEELPFTLPERVARARQDLRREGRPAIQGQNGSKDCLHAALLLIRGWCLYQEDAVKLLLSDYNETCVPPWSVIELQHKAYSAEHDVTDIPWRFKMSNVGGEIVDAIIAAADLELTGKKPDRASTKAPRVKRVKTPEQIAAQAEVKRLRDLEEMRALSTALPSQGDKDDG
jgi:hypothetical protein